ncbi:glycoside hydrolase family 3 protein [Legionella pneumophila]|uniref:Glycosyl hydrolase family protein n=1 Tax=Legionella pneumophila subsp. pascullei TaxID=91890 RepID=A0AAX2IW57_LEGPN|nr:glycoside hydrolase family 3 N-terminal domain-containing protein [Legionella pneumophila]AMP90104.1 glycosyl hydrolase [Legionella pneumophila subsp. pascullei]AMP92229.1 glycosyl hydrolase [Legionella pneumophila subsp. pascullei]AMP95194.1 glycosyl hydrolase [Legionella pneumophila subsp. pascullei]SQG90082.1 glycosyl hydrolase family protein [Legionella pneumophila subsp. pascullei]VEH05998.1 glycosyl hydrolase family protein [Legionella pneumophila subsp. pascullei]
MNSALKTKSIILSFFLILVTTVTCATEVSLRDKIGQMLILGFQGKVVDEKSPIAQAIEKDNIGGVILFDFNQQSQTFDKNIESPEQVNQLNNQLQILTQKANRKYHRDNLPLLVSVDYEGGNVNRLHPRYGFPAMPSAKDVGSMSLERADASAELMANTLKSTGFNLNFFPELDVNINPDNPIIGKKGRSFSSIPEIVTQYAQLYTEQFIKHQIHCSYKHFPGHGSSLSDSHLGFVDVSDTWSEQELIPFLQLLSQPNHCDMVMIAHIVNRKLDMTGLPASLSYQIINGLLRRDLKFDGVVITDDMQMKAITNYYGLETAVTLSINAGADMLIFGNQLVEKFQDSKEIIDMIEQKVRSGEISEQRINEAYQRIVKMKKSF